MPDTASFERVGQTAGSLLRSAREQKGLSLDDVARVTRITKGYLAALEENNYTKLPSDAYARGFLRVYAQFLGIDEQDILSLYQQASSPLLPLDEPKVRTNTSDGAEISPFTKKRWFWYLAVICALTVTGVLLFGVNSNKPDRKAENPVAVQPLMNLSSSSLQPQIAAVPDKEALKTPPLDTIETPPSPSASTEKSIVLKMKALEDGFLVVTIDDMISQQYDLKVGDVIEWKAEKVFSLDLDNAGGVEAELNGKILKPFGERGMSAHVVLKADTDRDETAP
jgi:transcriptional regulator with XRE-family HTH domain